MLHGALLDLANAQIPEYQTAISKQKDVCSFDVSMHDLRISKFDIDFF